MTPGGGGSRCLLPFLPLRRGPGPRALEAKSKGGSKQKRTEATHEKGPFSGALLYFNPRCHSLPPGPLTFFSGGGMAERSHARSAQPPISAGTRTQGMKNMPP